MYSRRLENGDAPTFGVTGKLWNGVLVMYDRASDSYWTQLDGRAIQGERTGQRLKHVESVFTTWAQWVDAHPETLVLLKPPGERGQQGSSYANYFADPDRLFQPELRDGLGGGVKPKDLIFGVFLGQDAWAVQASVLAERGVVNAVIGRRPVAIVRGVNGFVFGVDRRLGDKLTVLEPIPGRDALLVVRDVLSGEKIKLERFERIRVDRSFWYAWARSHPGSMVLAGTRPSAD